MLIGLAARTRSYRGVRQSQKRTGESAINSAVEAARLGSVPFHDAFAFILGVMPSCRLWFGAKARQTWNAVFGACSLPRAGRVHHPALYVASSGERAAESKHSW